MPTYIEYELENGGTVIVEVGDAVTQGGTAMGGGLEPVSVRGEKTVVEKAGQTFESAVSSVQNAANILLTKLKSLHDAPDEIEITFGFKASGELGGNFVMAKAGVEANYNVKLVWKKGSK